MSFLKIKKKKTIITTILLAFVLLASFSPILTKGTAKIAEANHLGNTWSWNQDNLSSAKTFATKPLCEADFTKNKGSTSIPCYQTGHYNQVQATTAQQIGATPATGAKNQKDPLADYASCSMTSIMPGCLISLSYILFKAFPEFLLGLAANLFNVVVAFSLSSKLFFATTFITDGWTLMRDLANLMFIFILLYIAIRTILGIGESENKKMIGTLIVVALLINFSMFFTKVIIDVSNQLGLIFYNSMAVTNTNATANSYIATSNELATGVAEKDVSSQIADGFKISRLISEDFFEKAKTSVHTAGIGSIATGAAIGSFIPIIGTGIGAVIGGLVGFAIPTYDVPPSILLAIILISGAVAGLAAYCFFMMAFALISRLVMLWILIIFSPIAFLTSVIPAAGHIESFGWSKWWHDLLSNAFMAPIFMFFLWLIMKLVSSDFITKLSARDFSKQGLLESLLLIILPASMIMILLLKAAKYAKKSSGELGGAIMKGAAFVGGATLGLAAGGVGLAANKYIGGWAAKKAENPDLLKKASEGDHGAARKLAVYKTLSKTNLDLGLGALGSATGLKKPKFFSETAKGLEKMGIMDIRTEGGYKGTATRFKEKEQHHLEDFKLTGKAAEDRNQGEALWKAKRDDKFVELKVKAQKAGLKIDPAQEAMWETAYNNGVTFEVSGKNAAGDMVPIEKVVGVRKAWTAERENRERTSDMASTLEFGHDYIHDRNEARDAQNNLIAQYSKAVVEGRIDSTKVPPPDEFDETEFRRVREFDPEYIKNLTESKVLTYNANKTIIDDSTKNMSTVSSTLEKGYKEAEIKASFNTAYTDSTPQTFANGSSKNWADDGKGNIDASKKKAHENNYVKKERDAMDADAKDNKARFDPEAFKKAYTSGGTYHNAVKIEGEHPSQRKASSGGQMAAVEMRKTISEKKEASASLAQKFAADRDIRKINSQLTDIDDNLVEMVKKLSAKGPDGADGKPEWEKVDGIAIGATPTIEQQRKMLSTLRNLITVQKSQLEIARLKAAQNPGDPAVQKELLEISKKLHHTEDNKTLMEKSVDRDQIEKTLADKYKTLNS